MTINVGFTAGLQSLRHQEALFDYIIQVGDYEIPVHKTVMASVSDYFRVMLCGSFLEAKTNKVELKGESEEVVSKLIELIYTGDENILKNSAMEIFGIAEYFQMPLVIKACVESILDNLTNKNCLEVLSLFVKYSMDEEVENVRRFLNSKNGKSALEYCKYEKTPFEVLQIVSECWGEQEWCNSEWDLFLFLKSWVSANYEQRKIHMNDLMSQVRFSLLEQGQIATIMQMDIFRSDEPWSDLVYHSFTYSIKTIPQRVLDSSHQCTKRSPPIPVAFTTGGTNSETFHALGRDNRWEKHEAQQPPTILNIVCTTDVNNFLIVCGGNGENQEWYIFDPRTKTWSQMANMHTMKTLFVLAHCEAKLYAIGGYKGRHTKSSWKLPLITAGVEMYDYSTDSWHVTNSMPSPLVYHGASSLCNVIYVAGGWKGEFDQVEDRPDVWHQKYSQELNCLDVRTSTWEKKAQIPLPCVVNPKLHVMTLHKDKVLVVIDEECQQIMLGLIYYTPATNQWSSFSSPRFPAESPDTAYGWRDESMILAKGNRVFFINVLWREGSADNPICVEWKFPETGNIVSETVLQGFISYDKPYEPGRKMFCSLLSM